MTLSPVNVSALSEAFSQKREVGRGALRAFAIPVPAPWPGHSIFKSPLTLKELRLLPGATNAVRQTTLHGLSSADCAHELELVARTWDHRNAALHDTFRSGPPEISEPASGATCG